MARFFALRCRSRGNRRRARCRSAPDRDPSELGSITLILLWETGLGWGPDRRRSGPRQPISCASNSNVFPTFAGGSRLGAETQPIACAAHKVQNSALEVYFAP